MSRELEKKNASALNSFNTATAEVANLETWSPITNWKFTSFADLPTSIRIDMSAKGLIPEEILIENCPPSAHGEVVECWLIGAEGMSVTTLNDQADRYKIDGTFIPFKKRVTVKRNELASDSIPSQAILKQTEHLEEVGKSKAGLLLPGRVQGIIRSISGIHTSTENIYSIEFEREKVIELHVKINLLSKQKTLAIDAVQTIQGDQSSSMDHLRKRISFQNWNVRLILADLRN